MILLTEKTALKMDELKSKRSDFFNKKQKTEHHDSDDRK
jgi:hypothetical protein